MTAIRWSSRARADLIDIGDYIARRSPAAATRFVKELMDRVLALAGQPRSGRVVPEIGDDTIRELIYGRHRIVYRLDGEEAQMLTVFVGHRLLPGDDLR